MEGGRHLDIAAKAASYNVLLQVSQQDKFNNYDGVL